MDFHQLKYFQVLARMQHMTHAAEHLSLSQPALSRSMAKLEEELGVPLFERHHRMIRLNRYGELFLKRVDRMLREMDEGRRELFELIHPERGEICLGFLHTLGTSIIPDLIRDFKKKYPAVHFQLVENHSYSLVEDLLNGKLDLCLLAKPISMLPSVQWTPLWEEEIYATLPPHHRLSGSKEIHLSELKDEHFIMLKKGYALRQTTDKMFQKHGLTPEISFESEEAATIAGMVGAGLGVSLLPDLKGLDQSSISQVHLCEAECHRIIGIAAMDEGYLSPSAQNFKQFVLERFLE